MTNEMSMEEIVSGIRSLRASRITDHDALLERTVDLIERLQKETEDNNSYMSDAIEEIENFLSSSEGGKYFRLYRDRILDIINKHRNKT